jgi:hypothetical protein
MVVAKDKIHVLHTRIEVYIYLEKCARRVLCWQTLKKDALFAQSNCLIESLLLALGFVLRWRNDVASSVIEEYTRFRVTEICE